MHARAIPAYFQVAPSNHEHFFVALAEHGKFRACALNIYQRIAFLSWSKTHACSSICTSNPSLFPSCTFEPWRSGSCTASVSHRRLQRMPPNGGEFSGWLDRSTHIERVWKCVKIWKLFRVKRSALEAAHAHLHDVRRRHIYIYIYIYIYI